MPTKIEKDAVTGRETTGHEWDGVKELNTPLPKWWLYLYIASVAYALVQFVLYPSLPGITGYVRGTLGWSQRVEVEQAVAEVAARRAGHMDRIAAETFDAIRQDGQLLAAAMTAGRITFANNCQPCHGPGGEGRLGYPALGDDVWLWGGTLEEIQHSITVGIRSDHKDTRASTMPAFGAGALKPEEIEAVTDHVMALYGNPARAETAATGAKVFADQCADCHGASGQGNPEKGGPRLAARVHLLGADRESVRRQIIAPRMGVMPAWNTRLDPATIKAVTLYVHQLGGGQ